MLRIFNICIFSHSGEVSCEYRFISNEMVRLCETILLPFQISSQLNVMPNGGASRWIKVGLRSSLHMCHSLVGCSRLQSFVWVIINKQFIWKPMLNNFRLPRKSNYNRYFRKSSHETGQRKCVHENMLIVIGFFWGLTQPKMITTFKKENTKSSEKEKQDDELWQLNEWARILKTWVWERRDVFAHICIRWITFE